MVHCDALTFEQQADPRIAKPAALLRNRAHLDANVLIIRPIRKAYGFRIDADQSAGSALADVVSLRRLIRRRPSILERRHSFPSKSFRTTSSSMELASNRLSRLSETSKPPYLAFHL
jgi:hypothetical protein